MSTIVLVIHLMVCLALIAVVLLQRSEGGALGIGGGGGGGGMMAGRGPANMLTRLTSILAGVFFLTSITLTILAGQPGVGGSILDRIDRGAPASTGTGDAPATGGGILDKITPPGAPAAPTAPAQ